MRSITDHGPITRIIADMNRFSFAVSLRMRHPDRDPKEISEILQMDAHRSWRAGAARVTPQGAALEGVHESSYWTHNLHITGDDELTDVLSKHLDVLESHREFLERFVRTGGRLEYFVGWFSGANSGGQFSVALLAKLVSLNIELALDVYCN